MNILLCPDKFKGSLSADEVCEALSHGLLESKATLQIMKHPMADGGDGSILILQSLLNLNCVEVVTEDPLRRPIMASYYTSKDAAFIELASASGIVLLSQSERNPMYTTTYGTGLMMKDAIDKGFRKIYLFIGGSATNDGGIGIAQGLGFSFKDGKGNQIEPIGKFLDQIHSIDHHNNDAFIDLEIKVLCDVNNPMFGQEGAAHIYAAQKGATPEEIDLLDHGLRNYANVLISEVGSDLSAEPGMGAAGAVGTSLVNLLGAELQNGFDMLAKLTGLEEKIKQADIVISGEGKVDATSFQGKVVGNVERLCDQYAKELIVVGGLIDKSVKHNLKTYTSMDLAHSESDSMKNVSKYLRVIGSKIGNSISL